MIHYYSTPFSSRSSLLLSVLLVSTISLLVFVQGQQSNLIGGAMEVKIVELPAPIDRAQSISMIKWQVPKSLFPIYCVGSEGISKLRFTCTDCNATETRDWIQAAQQTVTEQTTFPAIRIHEMKLNKTMNGRTLRCEGRYMDPVTQNQQVAYSEVRMNVQYLDQPLITNAKGEAAVPTSDGNRFYLQRGGGTNLPLRCEAEGNPRPTEWTWNKDGQDLANGQTYTVTQANIGSSIHCSVNNGLYPRGQGSDSKGVKIAPWDTPKLMQSNFKSIRMSNPNIFSNDNKVKIGSNVKMTCVVSGNPQPKILWLMQNSGRNNLDGSNSNIMNASCTSSQQILSRPGQPYNFQQQQTSQNRPRTQQQQQSSSRNTPSTVFVVRSECTVNVADYSYIGEYWCSACNQVSATGLHCYPPSDRPASPNVKINAYGEPMQEEAVPTAEQEENRAVVSTYYCSDPQPNAKDVYWKIGDQRVNINDEYGNFRAETPRPNGTSCYTARLTISPVTESDLDNDFMLVVRNKHGAKNIAVPVQSLLSSDDALGSGVDAGLIAGLVLGIIVLLLLCLVTAVLWFRKLACFKEQGKAQPEKLHSNVAPQHVRSAEPTAYGNGNSNGTNGVHNYGNGSDRMDYGGGYNNGGEKETLSYAQMDLVKEPPKYQISPAATPAMDYAHLVAPPQPLKPATNSVV